MDKRFTQPIPVRLPYFRHAWLIALGAVLLMVGLTRLGVAVPVPLVLLIGCVVVAASLGGATSGFASGVIVAIAILGVYFTGAPPAFIAVSAATGALLAVAIGTYIGYIRGTLHKLELELLNDQTTLADRADIATHEADQRGAELESLRDRLTQAQSRLRSVTRRWVDTQETERRSLARELHDDIGQCLTALRINLESNKNQFASDPAAKRFIETSYQLVDEVIASVRELQLNLRPSLLDDLGLFAALREYVNKQLSRNDIECEFLTSGSDVQIDPSHSIAAYRIAQEIVSNINKHAQASRVTVTVDVNPVFLEIAIVDDGIGFEIEPRNAGHYGLDSMRERAMLMGGGVDVSSSSGKGTQVVLTMPIRNAEESDAA
ncbi:MAG: sensor histidine kinase [Pseudomonadota bacterium]